MGKISTVRKVRIGKIKTHTEIKDRTVGKENQRRSKRSERPKKGPIRTQKP